MSRAGTRSTCFGDRHTFSAAGLLRKAFLKMLNIVMRILPHFRNVAIL